MDREAFLPLRNDEVTDQEAVCRLINYVDLFDPIVDELVSNRTANKKLGVGNDYYNTGRYFVVRDEFQLWLGVALKLWRDNGITPLWCQFKRLDSEAGITKDQFRANPELIAGAQFDGKGQLFVPIRLKTGVERDRVVGDAVAQIERVVDTLLGKSPEVSQT